MRQLRFDKCHRCGNTFGPTLSNEIYYLEVDLCVYCQAADGMARLRGAVYVLNRLAP